MKNSQLICQILVDINKLEFDKEGGYMNPEILQTIIAILTSVFFSFSAAACLMAILFYVDLVIDLMTKPKRQTLIPRGEDFDTAYTKKYKSFLDSQSVQKLFEIEGKDMIIT